MSEKPDEAATNRRSHILSRLLIRDYWRRVAEQFEERYGEHSPPEIAASSDQKE